MPAFPRFIGGPNLGSNLNASMTAKAEAVGVLLAIIFPGVRPYLVQGSPSGSSASGGTHAGPGDAADFVYRYTDGRAGNLAVYLMASLLWRMLDCLSYVRGFDVNKDGVPDDTFAQHDHIIDREGGGKVAAAVVQIQQYIVHLDGLVGSRPDRERVVPQTMTLAEYQTPAGRATFLARFQTLSSEALGLPVHIEPQEDEMNTYIFMRTVDTSIWLLAPGKPPRGLGIDEWNLWARLGATLKGGDFNKQQVDQISAAMALPAAPAGTAAIDPGAITAAITKAVGDALGTVTFTTRKAS